MTMKATTFINKLPENYVPIFYSHGYRGNAVNRILSAHQECWFQQLGDPISWTSYWVKEPWHTDRTAQMTAHGHLGIEYNQGELDKWGQGTQAILRCLQADIKKLVFFQLHPDKWISLETTLRPCVWLWSSDCDAIQQRFNHIFNHPEIQFQVCSKAISLPHVININIAKLFSNSYNEYIDEYEQLCHSLSLTPEPDRVRAFILRYNERELLAVNSTQT